MSTMISANQLPISKEVLKMRKCQIYYVHDDCLSICPIGYPVLCEGAVQAGLRSDAQPPERNEIDQICKLSTEEVFENLKGIEFFVDEDMLNKAVFKAFMHRREEAIELALDYLTLPEREINDGDLIDRSQEHYISKKILEVFPHASTSKVVALYESGDDITRGNLIQAMGNMAGGKTTRIRDLLIGALDDKTVFIEDDPEIDGDSLRICDLAYNQLVLRYAVTDVLRTIGYSNRIEMRDYHIDILKDKL